MSESWVDVPTNEMASPDTWHTMSLNALLDVKNQLLDKLYIARGRALYVKPLNDAMAKLDELIAVKLADPRGGS